MTIHLSFRKDDDEKICGNRCCWKDSFFGVFILLITMTALLWWKKTKKKPVRLRLTYEKEKHPEVHLTYFESLEFLKSFGCVEFENLLDWKIVKCALLMMLCWSLFLVIGMSLIMEGKDVSRNTENSALCVDSVLKECLFFFLVLVCFYWVMWNVWCEISAAPWSQDPYREQGVSLDTTCYIF